jgi:hypothetical protein
VPTARKNFCPLSGPRGRSDVGRQAKNEKIVAQNTGHYKDHLIDFRYQASVRGPKQTPTSHLFRFRETG